VTHEFLVALHVVDEAGYAAYRREMTPLLARAGGGFRNDFRVGEVLRSDAPHPVNRLFTIHFPDAGAAERFFADPMYLGIRERWFAPAVAAVSILATYTR
jgi:uncharacterized protein (DUF1330 family)